MPELTDHDLDAYLPSRMADTKMADVTYTDLNKYVIVHMSKWGDPVSGKIHRVEYRAREDPRPARDRYEADTLEKWQDDLLVETLSARQLLVRIKQWKYDPEPAMSQQVWLELAQPTYDVLVQWKENEGDVRHLVEIRKYHMGRSFDLVRDRECIYHMTKDMYEVEEEKMNNWLKSHKAKGDRKPGFFKTIRDWNIFGKRENIRSLLVELEALGDDT